MKARPETDLYLRSVEQAVANPGRWIKVEKAFKDYNASKTAACLAGGYLRVVPRDGDTPVRAEGRECIKTAAPVVTQIKKDEAGFTLFIRFEG